MARQFRKHYQLEEARALLPLVRRWLGQLTAVREKLQRHECWAAPRLLAGEDLGGTRVHTWVRDLSRFREAAQEFQAREILLKDIDRGLVDFPALRDGVEVLLCWEKTEDDIRFWHPLCEGYSGRRPIDDDFSSG